MWKTCSSSNKIILNVVLGYAVNPQVVTLKNMVRVHEIAPNNNGKCMSNAIKDLVELNRQKRQTYIKEKHSEAFQKALIKIQNYLEQYDPSKETIKVDINLENSDKNQDLCSQLVSYLRSKYIPCEYEYVPEWSDGHDWGPEHHYIVFKF